MDYNYGKYYNFKKPTARLKIRISIQFQDIAPWILFFQFYNIDNIG